MQLICNVYLSESDKSIIENQLTKLQDDFIIDLEKLEDELTKDHIKCLGWMIRNNKLEIKIAVINNNYGIQHEKIGILEDSQGNVISFMGSENETWMAWLANNEKFHVFRNWFTEETPHLESDILDFSSYWDNNAFRASVYSISEALKLKLIEIAPKTNDEFIVLSKKLTEKLIENNRRNLRMELSKKDWSQKGKKYRKFNPDELTPWNCQERAIEAFIGNNYKGILKMATGTGKTPCTLFIIELFFKEIKKTGNKIMILVPSGKNGIGGQWERFLNKEVSSNDYVFRYDSETSAEERRYLIRLWKKGMNPEGNLFVIITIQSLNNFSFNGIFPNFLIADEVHEYGTLNRIEIIKRKIGDIKYILSLSATPERYYDPEGTENIFNYFGPIVFRYSIKEAQNEEKKEGSETVLANYFYNVSIVNLNNEEEKRIKELTIKIGKNIAIEDDPDISEKGSKLSSNVERLLQERAKYIKTA
ncbi:MAG TPA: DEAD/DEAH box helicase family protein, partial [Candidatus Lokiarchaeia archaeon]